MAYQVVQYPIKAEPIPLGAAERATVDKWGKPPSLPVRRAPRALAVAMAFVPVIAAPPADTYVPAQHPGPIAVQSFQYDDSVAPVLTTVAPPTAVYVSAQSTDPIAIQSFQYDERAEPLKPISAVAETITVDKWQAIWPQPYFKPKRLVQYGVNFAIAEQADDGLPPVWWNKATPVEIPRYDTKRYQRLYPAWWGVRLDVVPPPETITVNKWFRELERPRKAPRPTWSAPSVSDQLFNVPTPPAVSAVYVGPQVNGPIWVQTFQYDDKAEPLKPIAAAAETITVDKWFRETEKPRWSVRRATNLGWWVIDPTLRAERASLDKWVQPQQIPRRDLKRLQYLYPSLAIDAAFYLVPSGVTDYLALSKDIQTATLYTSHSATGVLLLTSTSTGMLYVADVASETLFTVDVGTEP